MRARKEDSLFSTIMCALLVIVCIFSFLRPSQSQVPTVAGGNKTYFAVPLSVSPSFEGQFLEGPTVVAGTPFVAVIVKELDGFDRTMLASPDFNAPLNSVVQYRRLHLPACKHRDDAVYFVLNPTSTASVAPTTSAPSER